jgi:hypothetical protein
MEMRDVMLSRSGAKAKNLALRASEPEILRPEFILSPSTMLRTGSVEGASE